MMSMKVSNNLHINIFAALFLYDAIQKTSEGGLVMPRIISQKKKAESRDRKHGRTEHQKLTSYIVTQYLLKKIDEE